MQSMILRFAEPSKVLLCLKCLRDCQNFLRLLSSLPQKPIDFFLKILRAFLQSNRSQHTLSCNFAPKFYSHFSPNNPLPSLPQFYQFCYADSWLLGLYCRASNMWRDTTCSELSKSAIVRDTFIIFI